MRRNGDYQGNTEIEDGLTDKEKSNIKNVTNTKNFESQIWAKKDLGHDSRFLYRMPICLSRPLDCTKEETFFNSTGEVRHVFISPIFSPIIYGFRIEVWVRDVGYPRSPSFLKVIDTMILSVTFSYCHQHKLHNIVISNTTASIQTRINEKTKNRISPNDYLNKKNYLFRIESDYDRNIILEFDRDYGFDIEFHNRIWSNFFYLSEFSEFKERLWPEEDVDMTNFIFSALIELKRRI